MAWFGRRSTHRKQVDSALTVTGNLYEKTTEGGAGAPLVLAFELTDSHYRYLMFCLSTVQMACAPKMSNPDAVLNECLHDLVGYALSQVQTFFGGPIEPQKAANAGASYLEDYLGRWSAYVDIAKGGNAPAATSLISSMLRSAESTDFAHEKTGERLWPLACWIEKQLPVMRDAFTTMPRARSG